MTDDWEPGIGSAQIKRDSAGGAASPRTCTHGQVECDPVRATIRCGKCGASAFLAAQEAPAPEGLRAALLELDWERVLMIARYGEGPKWLDAERPNPWRTAVEPTAKLVRDTILAALAATPPAPAEPECVCADDDYPVHDRACPRAEARPPEGLDAARAMVSFVLSTARYPDDHPIVQARRDLLAWFDAQEAPAPEGLRDAVELLSIDIEALVGLVFADENGRPSFPLPGTPAGQQVLDYVRDIAFQAGSLRTALAATPPTPAETRYCPDCGEEYHGTACGYRAEARPPEGEPWTPTDDEMRRLLRATHDAGRLTERTVRGAEARPPEGLDTELRRERADHARTIEQRDRAEDMADQLAAALAPDGVLGEHTNMNDPWQNALDYAAEARPPERLDVERLARAIATAGVWVPFDVFAPPLAEAAGSPQIDVAAHNARKARERAYFMDRVAAAASEYARLSAGEATKPEPCPYPDDEGHTGTGWDDEPASGSAEGATKP